MKWLAALLAVMAVTPALTPALAQNIQGCGPRQAIVDHLKTNHDETIAAQGLSSRGWLLEVFLNREARSWTIISTRPNSLSCLHDEGASWTFFRNVQETEVN